MENVDAILYKKNIDDFKEWINALYKLGYTSTYKVLNSADFGIPQRRKRCFMVSILGDSFYQFPNPIPLKLKLKDLLEEDVDSSYYLKEKDLNNLRFLSDEELRRSKDCDLKKVASLDDRRFESERRVYSSEKLSPSITTKEHIIKIIEEKHIDIKESTKKGYKEAYEGDGIKTGRPSSLKRGRVQSQQSFTILTKTDSCGVVIKDDKELTIRRLTPRECWRLMGFSDEAYDKAAQVVSEHQLYILAGNSIVTNVLRYIFLNLY